MNKLTPGKLRLICINLSDEISKEDPFLSNKDVTIFNSSILEINGSDKLLIASRGWYGNVRSWDGYNFIILTDEKNSIKGIKNHLIIDKFPIKIKQIVEKINLTLLKQNFSSQSEIIIKGYNLNLNSREISKNNIYLSLTERETEIIMYLYNMKKPQSINTLQREVWGHNLDLETHTVETHIYRLRKKVAEKFKDEDFIVSFEDGYGL